ncbi:flagellar basal body rod protein FlgC [bacterium NHP-B]|nr:flagellar basal body rod protein FlgC [bacterium NHP-B]
MQSVLPSLYQSWHVLSRGMQIQSTRALIAAQNFTNAESVGRTPDESPYVRKMVEIQADSQPFSNVVMPKIRKISDDPAPPRMVYMPGHPAADNKGLVKMPHINKPLEAMDFKDANLGTAGCARLYALTTHMLQSVHNLMKQDV